MTLRVAVVTGANKGIGLAIVRSLCRHFGKDGVVYLTARDEGRGRAAVDLLRKEGLEPKFYLLDVTDQSSIDKLQDHLKKEHGGIDILINNAGIGTPGDLPLYERSFRVMNVNFFALLAVSRSLIPLVRSGGRIVNVASTTAYMTFRHEISDDVRAKFRKVKSEKDLKDLMNEYLEVCKAGTNLENGWSEWAYAISKLSVVVLSRIQARNMAIDQPQSEILVNACCPGFVQTDMTADLADNHYGGGKITTEEGADTPCFLALLPPDVKEPDGDFLLRRKIYDFIDTDVTIQI